MTIPENIKTDQELLNLYRACQGKNIKLRSRYTGVYLATTKRPYTIIWRVQFRIGTTSRMVGDFPFTLFGEKMAARAYRKYYEENKHKYKRERKKPKTFINS